ncbi:uncharacterized protein LOC123314119 [Coccinella septempunctata]|uniref:uncharacterized protein LOC123314119 n=1 Tax=Coccinella septempunctata TaxID=41139 RepID=UPI001D087352|nr:uncharacterized protein LOC123314119 [Coccinella septempunctata]
MNKVQLSFSCLAIVMFVSGHCDDNVKNEKLSRDCGNSYSMTCLKLDVVSFVDKLNEEEQFSVFPGISLVKENSTAQANTADMVSELAREFPNDAEARLDAFLLRKIGGYLSSHSIRLNLWNPSTSDVAEGRGKDKKNGMAYILAAAAMMKGTLMALAMGGLAALAGKALMTGMISLLLSAIIGLKSLTSSGGKQTTYEIVSKPVYSHTNSHSTEVEHGGHYSGYGRSLDVPLPIGLQRAYTSS